MNALANFSTFGQGEMKKKKFMPLILLVSTKSHKHLWEIRRKSNAEIEDIFIMLRGKLDKCIQREINKSAMYTGN
jgi:hypothetical protein